MRDLTQLIEMIENDMGVIIIFLVFILFIWIKKYMQIKVIFINMRKKNFVGHTYLIFI